MTRLEIIEKMNRMGEAAEPFFFVLGYDEHLNIFSSEPNHDSRFSFTFSSDNEINKSQKVATNLSFDKYPTRLIEYKKGFNKVLNNIMLGNTYLVNYTCSTPICINRNLKELYQECNAPYKLLINNQFVVFSPERFVKIADGRISTNPMKGTIDEAIKNAEELILADEKEAAEHATIVDLLRNDLSKVANRVKVKRYRYTERIHTNDKVLIQVSSEIEGELPADYKQNIGTIIAQMLPAGSVTGAPKDKTVSIIAESETHTRGFYTGVFGYFDGKTLDSAVIIRYIEQTPNGLVFKSGGGITANSVLEKEYQEMIDKVYVPII